MASSRSIFISYRRTDTISETGRIYDRLVAVFGKESIFMDVDSIPFGVDFAEYLDQAVGQCQIVLVIIGKKWLEVIEDDGTRRLDNPDDFVRIEVESALKRGIPVIPILLDGVSMPKQSQLPSTLHPLTRRNGTSVGYDPRFHTDMNRLVRGLQALLRGLESAPRPITNALTEKIDTGLLDKESNSSSTEETSEYPIKTIKEENLSLKRKGDNQLDDTKKDRKGEKAQQLKAGRESTEQVPKKQKEEVKTLNEITVSHKEPAGASQGGYHDLQGRANAVNIKVFGVGGAGCNAINRIIKERELAEIEFWALNTDAQSLAHSATRNTMVLGPKMTRGLGAGGNPYIGQRAAEESKNDILQAIGNANIIFIAAGMGGGTGTGAAPVVARIAQETGVLTIGIVTEAFRYEGRRRTCQAHTGVASMRANTNMQIVIPNDNLLYVVSQQASVQEAFSVADKIISQSIRAISNITQNLSLTDKKLTDLQATIISTGNAIVTAGVSGNGTLRIREAATEALSSILLQNSIEGARSVIFNIVGNRTLTIQEIKQAYEIISEAVDSDANIVSSTTIEDKISSKVSIVVIAGNFTSDKLTNLQKI